jgi:hypothetical protein
LVRILAKTRTISGSLAVLLLFSIAAFAADPLPSWNDTATKKGIAAFVERVTAVGSPDFVPEPERIATFDNDGTLWPEQPFYLSQFFTFDRIRALAAAHPEWQKEQPFKAVLEGDMKTLSGADERAFFALELAAHTGTTTDEYARLVKDWVAVAKHPRTGRLYTEMAYQPMLELLAYLRANGFKTFIVSGGWMHFMRPWTEKVYGIPPEQVVGSKMKTKFELRDGIPVITLLPTIEFVDDNVGKPIGINEHIGRRPVFACGNSDGDLQMLQWTTGGRGARFGLLVHHTDGVREWAYDRRSPIGRLDTALDAAKAKGWTVIDMKNDWRIVYAFEKK